MSRKVYHITKAEDGWQAKVEGGKRASVTGTTKKEVQDKTIEMAKNLGSPASVVIHGTDGRIQEERSYPRSSDPKSSKG